MPRIVALRPHSVAGVNLGHVTYQLSLGASSLNNGACFSLLFRYPPPPPVFRVDGEIFWPPVPATPLVQVPISLAQNEAEVERACTAAREGISEDISIRRVTEAFELFKNRPTRVSNDTVQRCVEDAAEVIRAYWQLRAWLQTGMTAKQEIVVKTSFDQREGQTIETTLMCCP